MSKQPSILEMRSRVEPPPRFATVSEPVPIKIGDLSPNASSAWGVPEAVDEMLAKYPDFLQLSPQERKRLMRSEIGLRRRALKVAQKEVDVIANGRGSKLGVLNECVEWLRAPLVLKRPDDRHFNHMRRALKEGRVMFLQSSGDETELAKIWERDVLCEAETFIVEHDWSAATGAGGLQGVEYKLPFDVCAFEFNLSDRPVIALATQFDSDVFFACAVHAQGSWPIFERGESVSALRDQIDRDNLLEVIGVQIKAICIALDANVAVASPTRAPYAGENSRHHKSQLSLYRVVSLANRDSRPAPLQSGHTGRRTRLHFRRGHWRHFETHKTWIKWMLVGNPDLGFIDKHYKL